LRKLCYIGPSWRQLHEGYAKNGLVDKNAAVCAVREIVIPGSPDQVWAVITDMKNWPAIRSDIHEVEIQGPVAAEVTFARAYAGRRLTSPSRSASRIAASSTRQLAEVYGSHRYDIEDLGDGRSRLALQESLAAPVIALWISEGRLGNQILSGLEGIRARVISCAWLEGPDDDANATSHHTHR
jgi:hypothetical protein